MAQQYDFLKINKYKQVTTLLYRADFSLSIGIYHMSVASKLRSVEHAPGIKAMLRESTPCSGILSHTPGIKSKSPENNHFFTWTTLRGLLQFKKII